MKDLEDNDEYYPLRWKLADAIEDAFLLHRAAIAGLLLLVSIVAIAAGFFVFNSGSTTTETAANETSSSTPPGNEGSSSSSIDTTTTVPETTTTSTTSSSSTTTAAPTTTTTTTTVSPRRSDDPLTVAATEPGRVLRLSANSVEAIGGLPDETSADDVVATAQGIFQDLPIEDRQIVNESFLDDGSLRIRLDAPDLFAYNSDVINATYLPAIDALASQIIAEDWLVEVGGHTDASGSDEGNQRLSEGRAQSAAQRLFDQGVDPATVTVVGFGESQPIASNATEAGRLLNRRLEFVIGP